MCCNRPRHSCQSYQLLYLLPSPNAAAEMAKQTVGGKKNAAVTLANKLAKASLYVCLMFLTLVNRIGVAKVQIQSGIIYEMRFLEATTHWK